MLLLARNSAVESLRFCQLLTPLQTCNYLVLCFIYIFFFIFTGFGLDEGRRCLNGKLAKLARPAKFDTASETDGVLEAVPLRAKCTCLG